MKRNRKIPKKMSVVATNTMRFGAIIVFFFVMVILNLLSSSSCTQLQNAKGELESEIARLEDAKLRESTRWEEMTTPEKVEAALNARGMVMKPPRAGQTVCMMANGLPRPGQLALLRAKDRERVSTASVSPALRTGVQSRPSYRRRRSR